MPPMPLRFSIALLCAGAASFAAAADLAGHYRTHGKNGDGSSYDGTMEIERKGDLFGLTFNSNGVVHGVGVVVGDQLVASFGDPACGVAAYRREGAGTLSGVWAPQHSTAGGTETATPTASGGTALTGDYVVEGTNVDKSSYRGALFISKNDDNGKMLFSWRAGGDDQRGFGFTHGGVIGVAVGPPSCGLAAYTLGADGALDGRWSLLGGSINPETAQKIN